MNHRYILESYTGPASRFECPACHQKRVFVRYVDTQTRQHLSPDVGRCNREDQCGYHYTPKQYFADHPDAKPEFSESFKKGQGWSRGKNSDKVTVRVNPESPQVEPDRIPKEYLIKALGYNSNFVRFLCTLFDRYDIESPTIERLMREYYLGCTQNGSVIFWQIDGNKRVRTGKIMQYNPSTGKRVKKESGAIDWVHSKLKHQGVLPDTWTLTQCLFGEHLLKHRPGATVCLVESEKSAMVGNGVMPGYVWLATGGKSNLKPETCRCLKGRDVLLFPDLGAFDDWKEKAERIAVEVGCTVQVSDLLEQVAIDADRAGGFDVADYLIRQLQRAGDIAPVSEGVAKYDPPAIPCTREEQALHYLTGINPHVHQLIDTLDLVSLSTNRKLSMQIC